MKLNLYSLKDNVSGSFSNITINENDALAIRDVKVAINMSTPNRTMVQLRPEDYTLYRLGSYESKTGVITSEVEFVVNCIDLKEDLERGKTS